MSMEAREMKTGNITILIPENGYIRLVVTGEEDIPADLTASAAALLSIADPKLTAGVENMEEVLFGVLETSDGVEFRRNNELVLTKDALAQLADQIKRALRKAVEAEV